MSERLLTVAEMAQLTDSTKGTIRRWIRDGRFEIERVGPTRRVRIRASVILRLFPHVQIDSQLTTDVAKRIESA